MKFKLFYLFIICAFILSCTNSNLKKNKANYNPYKSTGFALIYDEGDYKGKIISRKLNEDNYEIGHNSIRKNSYVKITNPNNMKSIKLKVTKKIDYPSFFNILITKKVSDDLNLNKDLPYVEITEIIKNKSFIAKKAVTFSEEQNVFNKAPVTKVKIDNISLEKNKNKEKIKKFSIIIGTFYSKESTEELKYILERGYLKKDKLLIKKLGKNKYVLSSRPHSSINTLKKVYFELNKYGLEDLDIKEND